MRNSHLFSLCAHFGLGVMTKYVVLARHLSWHLSDIGSLVATTSKKKKNKIDDVFVIFPGHRAIRQRCIWITFGWIKKVVQCVFPWDTHTTTWSFPAPSRNCISGATDMAPMEKWCQPDLRWHHLCHGDHGITWACNNLQHATKYHIVSLIAQRQMKYCRKEVFYAWDEFQFHKLKSKL